MWLCCANPSALLGLLVVGCLGCFWIRLSEGMCIRLPLSPATFTEPYLLIFPNRICCNRPGISLIHQHTFRCIPKDLDSFHPSVQEQRFLSNINFRRRGRWGGGTAAQASWANSCSLEPVERHQHEHLCLVLDRFCFGVPSSRGENLTNSGGSEIYNDSKSLGK